MDDHQFIRLFLNHFILRNFVPEVKLMQLQSKDPKTEQLLTSTRTTKQTEEIFRRPAVVTS